MPLSRKAGVEANKALLTAYNEYRALASEAVRFELAKAQNQDRLPLHMWREWRDWKKRLRVADEKLEKFYR